MREDVETRLAGLWADVGAELGDGELRFDGAAAGRFRAVVLDGLAVAARAGFLAVLAAPFVRTTDFVATGTSNRKTRSTSAGRGCVGVVDLE